MECPAPGEKWYVGQPDMISIADWSFDSGEAMEIRIYAEVTSMARQGSRWLLNGDREFDFVIAALPVAQLSKLLPPQQLQELKLRISYSALFQPSIDVPWRIAFTEGSPISLVLNDSSRHGAAQGGHEAWVAQTTTEWALAQVQAGATDAELAETLHSEFARLVGVDLPRRVDHSDPLMVWRWGLRC